MKSKKLISILLVTAMTISGCSMSSSTDTNTVIETGTLTEQDEEDVIVIATGTLDGNDNDSDEDIDTESYAEVSEDETEDIVEDTSEEFAVYEAIGQVTSADATADIYTDKDVDSDIAGTLYRYWYINVVSVEDEWLYVQNAGNGVEGYVLIEDVLYGLYDENGKCVMINDSDSDENDEDAAVTESESDDVAEISTVEDTSSDDTAENESSSTATSTYVLTTDAATILERIEESTISATGKSSLWNLCETMASTGTVSLSGTSLLEFLNFYCDNFAIVQPNGTFSYYQTGNTLSFTSISETVSARKSTIETVLNKVGVEEVSDPYQAVRDACTRIRAALTFNYSYTSSSTSSAFNAGQGVCVHYSRAACIILNAEGIPCRIVSGTYNGGSSYHSWNEVYIDGEWITIDFCEFTDQSSRNPDGFVTSSYASTYTETYTMYLY